MRNTVPLLFFFFSSRRRHTRFKCDWSSDVCSSDLLYLDYEAYEEMALKQMESLAGQVLSQFQVRDVALVHRLGRLEIAETSVPIVVASPPLPPPFHPSHSPITPPKPTAPTSKTQPFDDP